MKKKENKPKRGRVWPNFLKKYSKVRLNRSNIKAPRKKRLRNSAFISLNQNRIHLDSLNLFLPHLETAYTDYKYFNGGFTIRNHSSATLDAIQVKLRLKGKLQMIFKNNAT